MHMSENMSTSGIGLGKIPTWLGLLLFTVVVKPDVCVANDNNDQDEDVVYYTAFVNLSYADLVTGKPVFERNEMGVYGTNSLLSSEMGMVVHVRDDNNKHEACTVPVNHVPPDTKWIALVSRGNCKFQTKIYNCAILRNASAVVIYDNNASNKTPVMKHNVQDVVSIMVTQMEGRHLAALVDNNTKVFMQIDVGQRKTDSNNGAAVNRTSVLFVSISFIVLMVISLAWLVFYYVQRFRYAHAKERLSRRLAGAAKKAIVKIPLRTIKSGDKETAADASQCAVCIESFKPSEVVRELPCKHIFHKSCVDPWLLEQRNCPMCKMDILKAYGLHIPGSSPEDSIGGMIAYDVSSLQGLGDDDVAEQSRSIQMVHAESGGILFHNREDSLNVDNVKAPCETVKATSEGTNIHSGALDRHKAGSRDSLASDISIKSTHSICNECQSLIINPGDPLDLTPVNCSKTACCTVNV